MPIAIKNITLQEDKPSLRVTSGGRFASAKRICVFLRPSSQENSIFSKFHGFHVPRLHHGETLLQLKLFAQPMDRADVLHAPRYDIRGSWKNTPRKNDLVLSSENSTFPKLSITYVRVYLPLNMPAATKSITLQEDKPSLRVMSWWRFASAKPICDFEHHFEPGAASF